MALATELASLRERIDSTSRNSSLQQGAWFPASGSGFLSQHCPICDDCHLTLPGWMVAGPSHDGFGWDLAAHQAHRAHRVHQV